MKVKLKPFVRWLGIYFLFLITGAMNIGAVGSLLKILAIIPVGIWLITNHIVKKNKMLFWVGCFMVVCIISMLFTIDFSITKTRVISQVTFFTLLLAISGYRYNTYEIEYLKKCLVWSSRITAILVLITGSYYEGRIFLNGAVNEDPNYLSAYFLFAIISALSILVSELPKKKKIVSGVELILYAYIVIGTGSRGGLLAIVAGCLTWFLFYREEKLNKKIVLKKMIIIIGVIVLGAIISSVASTEILNRFSVASIKSSNGTGRYDLWEDAINAFSNSTFFRQIFGYGTGTAMKITYLFPFKYHNFFHNMFIETLLELGMLGLFFYVSHIFSFVLNALNNRDFFSFSIIVGMIVLSLSTSIYAFKPYWNIMIFIMCVSLKNKEIYESKYNCTSLQC